MEMVVMHLVIKYTTGTCMLFKAGKYNAAETEIQSDLLSFFYFYRIFFFAIKLCGTDTAGLWE